MAMKTLRCPAQLRSIALSRISVPDGFNPRGQVAEDPHLDALAQTMRIHGCLQPIRVREDGHGDYVLIAGERRYRAAARPRSPSCPRSSGPPGSPTTIRLTFSSRRSSRTTSAQTLTPSVAPAPMTGCASTA
jgi:hypothetical protein